MPWPLLEWLACDPPAVVASFRDEPLAPPLEVLRVVEDAPPWFDVLDGFVAAPEPPFDTPLADDARPPPEIPPLAGLPPEALSPPAPALPPLAPPTRVNCQASKLNACVLLAVNLK